MSEELKPCPFCKGEARLYSVIMPFDADCDTITIQCGACDAIGATVLVDQDVHTQSDLPSLEAEAIAAWNTRQPATTEALAAMEQAREALSAFTMCARYQPHMGGEASFKGWAQNDLRAAEAKARQALATLTEQIERMRNGQ